MNSYRHRKIAERKNQYRGVAQLVARLVRDQEVGRSSRLTPTISRRHLGEQGGMKKTPVYRGFSSMLCINFSSIDETFADRVAPKNKCRNWYLKYNLIKSGADAPLFYLFGANGTSLFTSLFVYSPSVGSLYTSKRPFLLPQIYSWISGDSKTRQSSSIMRSV